MTPPIAEYDSGNTSSSAMTAFKRAFPQVMYLSRYASQTVSEQIEAVDALLVTLHGAPQTLTQCQTRTNTALSNEESSFQTLASLQESISAESGSEGATWARGQLDVIQRHRHQLQQQKNQLVEKRDELNALLGEALLSLPLTTSAPVDLFDQIGLDMTGATEAYDQYTL